MTSALSDSDGGGSSEGYGSGVGGVGSGVGGVSNGVGGVGSGVGNGTCLSEVPETRLLGRVRNATLPHCGLEQTRIET